MKSHLNSWALIGILIAHSCQMSFVAAQELGITTEGKYIMTSNMQSVIFTADRGAGVQKSAV